MTKHILTLFCAILLLCGCSSQYNRVYKSSDYISKYEYAKEYFAHGRFTKAIPLLQDVVTSMKGTENAEECLYMLAMSYFSSGDYESASSTFKKYFTTYPKGVYAERASYYIGQSLYQSTPEPRLDQTPTVGAIAAYQEFMDYYPDSKMRQEAQAALFALQDKLVEKEYLSARLYYNLGDYFGNCTNGGSNYEACIVTAQNALKTYPYTDRREDFAVLIMKSKYELARQSVEAKRLDRYRDAEDECYGFINEYPDSEERPTAEKYIRNCKKVTND